MKCMIIAALAIVAAVQVQTKPYGSVGIDGDIGLGEELGDLGAEADLGLGGLGVGGGLGLGVGGRVGLGVGGRVGLGGYGAGGGYGHRGYVGSHSRYGSTGYNGGALSVHHNIGHQENDFDQETHHHSSSGHSIGGLTHLGQGGHSMYGDEGYGAGNVGYGNQYEHGYGI